MISRSYNPKDFERVAVPLLEKGTIGFDAFEIVGDFDNILLTDNEGNYSLFESSGLGVYHGHYFLSNKRGREALTLCKQMLDFFFNHCKDAALIVGATPVGNKKATWMSRQLGFKHSKTITSQVGDLDIYFLTEEDFYNE